MAAKKKSTKAKAKTTAKKKKAAVKAPVKKKKVAAKKKAAAAPKRTKAAAAPKKKKAAAAPKKKAVARRDATGHLNPKYAAELRARSRENREPDGGEAFIRRNRAKDTLAEQLGEEAVQTMTSAEDQSDQLQEADFDEEIGGPFVTTSAGVEFAEGTDASNPRRAKREPFPKT